jgi:hypothetical protein
MKVKRLGAYLMILVMGVTTSVSVHAEGEEGFEKKGVEANAEEVFEEQESSEGIEISLGETLIVEDGKATKDIPEGITFESSTNTLTLDNFEANYCEEYSEYDGLYIHNWGEPEAVILNLVGENTIGDSYVFAKSRNGNEFFITGNGILNLVAPKDEGMGTLLYVNGNFTMDSGTLNILGSDEYGAGGILVLRGDASFLGGEVNIYQTKGGIDVSWGNLKIENMKMDIKPCPGFDAIDVGEFSGVYGQEQELIGGILSVKNSRINIYNLMEEGKCSVRFYEISEEDKNGLMYFIGDTAANTKVQFDDAFTLTDDPYHVGYTYYACTSPYLLITTEGMEEHMEFEDVITDDWYYSSVAYANTNGLMTGINETTFAPLRPLDRAQFSVILHRISNTPKMDYTAKFPDVAEGIWYTDAVLWANSVGIVNGYEDTGCFGPSDWVTREQMAVMMYRYANYMEYDTSEKEDIGKFADASSVSEFAKEAMEWAVGTGIIKGQGSGIKLDPQGNANRAECATIIMRFVEKYQK